VGKNVAVFVDVANIFYAAKAAGVDIDYVTLLRSASAGRDLVRAYAYTGLDPDNENQRNFHSFLARNGYKVVSKDIRKYGDGKVKANLDIELVVDMMKTARNLDIAIVVSGDGDFAPAIRAVQEMGVRCEVISFRGNTSSDLIEVADLFTDITQLAKVERGSRSGRRVAEDEQDLSMTEVPDKQTEGTGRGRGRGRGRDRASEREPVAASGTRGRRRSAPQPVAEAAAAGVVALPGERLSRSVGGGLTEADLARAEVFRLDDDETEALVPVDGEAAEEAAVSGDEQVATEDGQRRRRRRGGRGRGRGRGRGEAGEPIEDGEASPAVLDAEEPEEPEPVRREAPARRAPVLRDEEPAAPRAPRSTPFGSVWDSQLGTATPSSTSLPPLPDEEFDDEPEIPEYLIAERNRSRGAARGGGRGGGVRGGRAAYQSAIARERYGRGGGGGGINRYPDVSERTTQRPAAPAGPREQRAPRQDRPAAPAASRGGGEWSEVPPELEELLRAQLTHKAPAARPPEADVAAEAEAPAAVDAVPSQAPKRRTTRRSTAAPAAGDEVATDAATDAASATPARRRTTKRAAASESADTAVEAETQSSTGADAPAPKRRTTRRTTAATADTAAADEPTATATEPATPAPRRRTTRKAAAESEVSAGEPAAEASPAPRRRTPRKAAPTETA
jgi:uncharacterized LabA/DUF88 family protein